MAVRAVLVLFLLASSITGVAAQDPLPPMPEPPAFTVIRGRTYDPDEPLVTPLGRGTLYYVDGLHGSDGNDGRSPSRAFRTLGRALDRYATPLRAGDTLLIRSGLYRERIELPAALQGTAADRIVIGPFGDGEVIVDTSDAVEGWTRVSGEVYCAEVPFPVTAVVVDSRPLFPEFSSGALTEGTWYHDPSAGALFLWAPGGGNPAGHDTGIIPDDEYRPGIFVNGARYVTLYGITERFSAGHGVSILGDHIRVERCRLLFNGKSGLSMFSYGEILSTGTEAVRNYAYHNMLRNWPRGRYKWGGWAAGMGGATPNALYRGNIVQKTGGEGILNYIAGGTAITDNVVFDSWSVNVYVDNQVNTTVEGNWIFCSEPDPRDTYNNLDPDPSDGRVLRRLRAEGIMTADEEYGLSPPARLENVTVVNNVIINCRRGIQHYAMARGSGLKNIRVLHNTIVVPSMPRAWESSLAGMSIPYNGGNNQGAVYRNNIVYATNSSTYVLFRDDLEPGADPFGDVTLDHNLWYHGARSDPFHWGPDAGPGHDLTFSQWLSLPGSTHGSGDQLADPGFFNSTSFVAREKKVAGGSPAVDSGIPGGITTDFDHMPRPWGRGYDKGAFEMESTGPLPSLPRWLRVLWMQ